MIVRRIVITIFGLAAVSASIWLLVGADSRMAVTAWISERFAFDSAPADAMVVGNSMAPAIRGSQYQLGCPGCNWDTDIAAESFDPTLLFCANCSMHLKANFAGRAQVDSAVPVDDESATKRNDSDRSTRPTVLLTGDQTRLQIGKAPQRWDCVLVREPDYPMRAVKRLVGFPGEVMEVREGDLYINGKISSRSPFQILSMSSFVHDAGFAPVTGDRWKEADPEGVWLRKKWPWRIEKSGVGDNENAQGDPNPKSNLAWLVYHHDEPWPLKLSPVPGVNEVAQDSQSGSSPKRECPITDWVALNSNFSGTLYRCNDLILRVDLQIDNSTKAPRDNDTTPQGLPIEVAVLVRDLKLRLPVVVDDLYVTSPLLRERWEHRSRPFTIYFVACDRKVGLVIRDSASTASTIVQGEMQEDAAFAGPVGGTLPMLSASAPIAIGIGSERVLVDRLALGKDIYYRPSPLRRAKESDAIEGYFLLGDNTQISIDSGSNLRWIQGVPESWIEGVVQWESASWWQ